MRDTVRNRPRRVTYEKVDYDLTHTFTREFIGRTLGAPMGVRVKCVMSCHCFTLDQSADPDTAFDYAEDEERRVFCPERHELSKRIYGHFENALMHAKTYKVFWEADKSGSINNLTVDDPNDGYRYCMYFDVSRHGDDKGAYILLQIRSAYRRHIRLLRRDCIRMGTLIDRALGFQPPKPRKRRRKK